MTNAVIGALRVVLGMDTAQFENDAAAAKAKAKALGSALQTGLTVAAAAATAAAGAIGVAMTSSINQADEMSKAAAKVGVPIEELSRLKYAADLSGVSFEQLQVTLAKTSKVMNEAKNGSAGAVDTFDALGVAFANADGTLRPVSDVMKDVADKFAAMPDGAEKTALAMELMGKSGASMIPMLNGGADALATLMGEADAFGQVFTAEMGANAEAFNDNISRLQGALGAMAAALASGALPYLADFSGYLVELAGYFRSLSPEVQSFVAVAGALTVALTAVLVPLGMAAVAIGAIGGPVVAAVAGVTALAAAGAYLYTHWDQIREQFPIVAGVIDTAIGVIKVSISGILENARLMATGIVQLLSGDFSGAWQTAQDLVHNFWSTLGSIADTILPGFTESLRSLAQIAVQVASDVAAAFAALPAKMLEIGMQIIDGLWQGIQSKWAELKDGVAGIASGIKDSFTGFFDINSPSRVMAEVGTDIMAGLNQGLVGGTGSVVASAQTAAQGINGALGGIKDFGASISGSIDNAFSSLGSGLADVIKGTKSWKDLLSEVLSQLASTALRNVFSGLGGGGGGGFFSSLLGGLFGFANGGQFQVGGAGGVDSQLVAFKASPNETVSITKPGQGRGGTVVYAPVIDARGADQGAIARLQRQMDEQYRNFGKMVDRRVGDSQTRKTRG